MKYRRLHIKPTTIRHLVRWTIVHFFLLLICLPVHADDSTDALVLIQKGDKKAIFQGEKLSFYVKLLSSTWFSGSPRFDLPDMRDGLLYQVQNRPILGSEQIHGQSYTSQLHEFWFFPKKEGEITLPEISVSFSTAVPGGGKPLNHQLRTSPFRVSVKPIPGAGGDTQIISTSRFDVLQSWDPEPTDTITGSATTRKIQMRAADMASIFLPEISFPPIEGVAIYRKPADVNDFNERGEATAERRDSATYLFEKEGTYTIPDIQLQWWNSIAQKMEEVILPGVQIEISPDPIAANSDDTSRQLLQNQSNSQRFILAILAGVGILLALAFRFGPSLTNRIHQRKKRYEQSEPAFFRAFRKACRNGDITAAYNHLYFWVRKRSGKRVLTLEHFRREHVIHQLDNEISTVEQQLFDKKRDERASWQGADLFTQVARARKKSTVAEEPKKTVKVYRELNF